MKTITVNRVKFDTNWSVRNEKTPAGGASYYHNTKDLCLTDYGRYYRFFYIRRDVPNREKLPGLYQKERRYKIEFI